mgnify:CR=1 FL=1
MLECLQRGNQYQELPQNYNQQMDLQTQQQLGMQQQMEMQQQIAETEMSKNAAPMAKIVQDGSE